MINTDIKITAVYSSEMLKKTQFRIRELKKPLFKGSQGYVIFYDKSDRKSFENIEKTYRRGINLLERDLPKCLLGLKSEYDVVTFEEGLAKASELNMPYFETKGGEELFRKLQDLGLEWDDYYNKTFRFKEYFDKIKQERLVIES